MMNQCDGCRRGLPLHDGRHDNPDSGWDGIQCTAHKYACQLPPWGWSCTRDVGHDGPCAARPTLEGLMRENGVKHECPVCPTEIRNLFAVAHNLIAATDRNASRCKIVDKMNQLREAVKAVQPLVVKHFEEM